MCYNSHKEVMVVQGLKMKNVEKYLTIIVWTMLISAVFCIIFDIEGSKTFVDVVTGGFVYLFFGSFAFCIVVMIVSFLFNAICEIRKKKDNKLIATISLILFLIFFAITFIFDSGIDIPYARFYAR